jgi:hypothetical protein
MAVKGAGAAIRAAVMAWPGVEAHSHQFGGTEYRLGRREIGHVHGDWLADLPFPTRVRDALVAAGRAEPHHVLPESGWVSFFLRAPGDVERAVALFRESYELAREQQARRSSAEQRSSAERRQGAE